MRFLGLLALTLLGCGAAPSPPPSTPSVARAELVPEPAKPIIVPTPKPPRHPQPLFRNPRDLGDLIHVLDRDDPIVIDPLNPRGYVSVDGSFFGPDKKSDYWSPCVRDFVETQVEPARVPLGEALSLYASSCNKGKIEFRPPTTGRGYATQSQLGLVGSLGRTTFEVALRVAYRGDAIEPTRITLIADGVRWSSSRLDFERSEDWTTAALPFTRSLARVVRHAIDAHDAVLRFESDKSFEDAPITDEMKQDLSVMIDALELINRP